MRSLAEAARRNAEAIELMLRQATTLKAAGLVTISSNVSNDSSRQLKGFPNLEHPVQVPSQFFGRLNLFGVNGYPAALVCRVLGGNFLWARASVRVFFFHGDSKSSTDGLPSQT